MSTALQLQFFMVQAVNYSVITVKIKCKVSARVSEAAMSRLGLGSEGLVHIPV